ncbi:MAG: CDP-alcohol phosphatidyltransferase family protein [Desulfobacter sp.]|nr:MAG: CDP-alcohol phosphatidyltransferase family protein [Desulfobacter sp.]
MEKKHGQWIKAFYRRVSYYLCLVLIKTPIRPNHLTASRLLWIIIAGSLIQFNEYRYDLLASFMIFLFSVLDAADGTLARMKNDLSLWGTWLDNQIDRIGFVILYVAVGFRLGLEYENSFWVLFPLVVLLMAWVRVLMCGDAHLYEKFVQLRGLLEGPNVPPESVANVEGKGAKKYQTIMSQIKMQIAPHTHNLALYVIVGLVLKQLVLMIVFTAILTFAWWGILNYRVWRKASMIDRK